MATSATLGVAVAIFGRRTLGAAAETLGVAVANFALHRAPAAGMAVIGGERGMGCGHAGGGTGGELCLTSTAVASSSVMGLLRHRHNDPVVT